MIRQGTAAALRGTSRGFKICDVEDERWRIRIIGQGRRERNWDSACWVFGGGDEVLMDKMVNSQR